MTLVRESLLRTVWSSEFQTAEAKHRKEAHFVHIVVEDG